jgi:hypothetical protein
MRAVVTPKGSRFLLCQLSRTVSAFSKYPPQPVLRCNGYRLRGNNEEELKQPQPVRRNPPQLGGREDGAALAGVVQGLALGRGVNNVGPMAQVGGGTKIRFDQTEGT